MIARCSVGGPPSIQPSGISVADLAVALLDEAERPAAVRRSDTVGY